MVVEASRIRKGTYLSVISQDGQSNEYYEVPAEIVSPQSFPQGQHIIPFKFALEPHEKHAKKEEEIGAIPLIQMPIQLSIRNFDKLVESA